MSKSKYLDLAGLTAYDGKIKEWIKSSVVDITDDAIRVLFVAPVTGPADNEIWYTSSDGNVIGSAGNFGANIINDEYNDGHGVITFDGPVTSIGNGAFDGCYSLTSITIPNSVTSIWGYAFYNCSSLTSIVIPDSVTNIGSNVFAGCSSLTSVIIGNSVTSIGEGAFIVCSSLASITIPNSVTEIEDRVFLGCSALTSITFEGTIAQWNSITKGENWNNNVPATYVQCTDGQAPL